MNPTFGARCRVPNTREIPQEFKAAVREMMNQLNLVPKILTSDVFDRSLGFNFHGR